MQWKYAIIYTSLESTAFSVSVGLSCSLYPLDVIIVKEHPLNLLFPLQYGETLMKVQDVER